MQAVPKLKLTYFDFHGGRGEVARIALEMAKISFIDERVKQPDWPELKATTPFGKLPLLEVDGQQVAQSNTINRFVGKLTGLYPEDPLQAAYCDEVMDAIEEITPKIEESTRLPDGEAKRLKRQELADGPIPFYLRALAERLARRGGTWFADGRLTVADLKVFLWVRHLKSGRLDHIPTDLPDRVAPSLVEHWNRVKSDPRVQAYYTARGIP
jgi:prostaglandin-H2 D-isomerase / glutathione transferase